MYGGSRNKVQVKQGHLLKNQGKVYLVTGGGIYLARRLRSQSSRFSWHQVWDSMKSYFVNFLHRMLGYAADNSDVVAVKNVLSQKPISCGF